jgi:hypothetical protein
MGGLRKRARCCDRVSSQRVTTHEAAAAAAAIAVAERIFFMALSSLLQCPYFGGAESDDDEDSSDGDEWLLPWAAFGIELASSAFVIVSLGFAAELSTAVGAAFSTGVGASGAGVAVASFSVTDGSGGSVEGGVLTAGGAGCAGNSCGGPAANVAFLLSLHAPRITVAERASTTVRFMFSSHGSGEIHRRRYEHKPPADVDASIGGGNFSPYPSVSEPGVGTHRRLPSKMQRPLEHIHESPFASHASLRQAHEIAE